MRNPLTILTILALLAATAAAADPNTPTVDEIVAKTNFVSYYQGDDGRAEVKMTIVDARGNQRNREFIILRRDEPDPNAAKTEKEDGKAESEEKDGKPKESHYTGDQKFYVYFQRPADVNNMAFLVHKHMAQGKDDDRWLYLPGLDLVKRIAASDKRTSFVGSHFFYEDVSGRSIEADKHELVETTKDYYVLKNTPKDPKAVEFAHFKMWIHRKSFVAVQTSYYDPSGKEYRRYNALKVETIQGRPTVTKSRMSDLKNKEYTEMEYPKVEYDVGLPDDIFAERYLRKPPLGKWIAQ